jgi:hypothetical protein
MPEPRTKPRKTTAKVAPAERRKVGEDAVSPEEIARRAYEIAHGADAGSDEENWLRAERELRSGSTQRG